MEGSGKWLVTALALKTKARSTKYKMARYDIGNVSMKDFVNKIIEFQKFVKVPHFKKEPKHEPTLSYLHLVECLQKCMMRSGDHKQHVHDSYEKRWLRHQTLRIRTKILKIPTRTYQIIQLHDLLTNLHRRIKTASQITTRSMLLRN